jgi:hypothetical protein
MKTFFNNPLEAFFNIFGYTMYKKPSMLLMSMIDFTNETYFEGVRRQGRMNQYNIKH